MANDPAAPTSLLPLNATDFEAALSLAGGAELQDLKTYARALRTLWDPWTCPVSELKLLAWAWSVDFFNEAWTEGRKRQVIAESRLYHARKTSVAGYRMALGYRDATLVRAHLPRQGFFVDRKPDPAEEAAWLAGLPEIRIYDAAPVHLARRPAGHLGVNLYIRDDARLSRRAVLVRDGSETSLRSIPSADPSAAGERLVLPVTKQNVLVIGRAGSRFVAPNDSGAVVLAVRTGATGDNFTRGAATPGDEGTFIASRRRQVDSGTAAMTPLGRGGLRIIAPVAIAQGYLSLRFSDQPGRLTSRAPSNVLGRSRIARAPYTANFLVSWEKKIPRSRLAPGRRIAAPSEPLVRGLMDAIASAQALRDRNSISLSATRRLTYADLRRLKAGMRFGDRRGT